MQAHNFLVSLKVFRKRPLTGAFFVSYQLVAGIGWRALRAAD
jgi:hypothetical protein